MSFEANHPLRSDNGAVDGASRKVETVAWVEGDRSPGVELEGDGARDDVEDLMIGMGVRRVAITRIVRPAVGSESLGGKGSKQFTLAWWRGFLPACHADMLAHLKSPHSRQDCRVRLHWRRAQRDTRWV